jgi:predicted RNA binding protein YcfA (HicA-like mRNA interferase family)
MPSLGPVKRNDLVQLLREAGFEGPFSGGKHAFMIRGSITLRIPNPHRRDVSVELLVRILRQAGISREEWERL